MTCPRPPHQQVPGAGTPKPGQLSRSQRRLHCAGGRPSPSSSWEGQASRCPARPHVAAKASRVLTLGVTNVSAEAKVQTEPTAHKGWLYLPQYVKTWGGGRWKGKEHSLGRPGTVPPERPKSSLGAAKGTTPALARQSSLRRLGDQRNAWDGTPFLR